MSTYQYRYVNTRYRGQLSRPKARRPLESKENANKSLDQLQAESSRSRRHRPSPEDDLHPPQVARAPSPASFEERKRHIFEPTESWYPNSGGSAKGSSLTNPHQETTVNWLNLSNSNWAPLQNFQSKIPPPFPALTIVDSLHDEGPAWLDIKIWACQKNFIKILASLE